MNKLYVASALAGAILLGGGASASAANYIQVSGEHLDFFYDADLYGAGTATVVGDSISFLMPSSFATTSKVKYAGDTGHNTVSNYLENGLIVVAHSGYNLESSVTTGGSLDLISSNGGSSGSLQYSGYAYSGSFINGVVTKPRRQEFIFGGPAIGGFRLDTAGTKTLEIASTTSGNYAAYSTLILETGLFYGASQTGKGVATVDIGTLSFGFKALPNGTTPTVPVPEPETYAMLLAGVGLIGAIVRRRKGAK